MARKQSKTVNIGAGLPLDLGQGLLLRWATKDDVEQLAQFNIQVHSDNVDQPQDWLGDWTRDLMMGNHPTTTYQDFTVVEDTKGGNKIVSSLCLISQTWTFDGIPFDVGRIELVGTDPAYRKRGLVRKQMEAIHLRSEAKGEIVQSITGIPWYYRQFGYEMALNLSGGRDLFWVRRGNDSPQKGEKLKLRPAEPQDISLLEQLYEIHCDRSLIRYRRSRQEWEFGLFSACSGTPGRLSMFIIENEAGQRIGYINYWSWETSFIVREMAVKPGVSWRQAGLFLMSALKLEGDELNKDREKQIANIYFNLGETHPVYDALGKQLERQRKPYAWYIRIANLKQFVSKIAPALETRLGHSVIAGYSGVLRLNFYRDTLRLTFENGRLAEVDNYEPDHFADADALFPEKSFYQLLLGYRSFDELDYAFADCYANKEETAVLLRALFPRRPSDISPLS